MVIDSSALIAIMLNEPERRPFLEAILASPTRLIGAPTMMEAGVVVLSQMGQRGLQTLRDFCREASIETVAFAPVRVDLALDAFRRFGKGRDPAALNLGDCFSHATAKEAGEPLLFWGNDFTQTDIRPVQD